MAHNLPWMTIIVFSSEILYDSKQSQYILLKFTIETIPIIVTTNSNHLNGYKW